MVKQLFMKIEHSIGIVLFISVVLCFGINILIGVWFISEILQLADIFNWLLSILYIIGNLTMFLFWLNMMIVPNKERR